MHGDSFRLEEDPTPEQCERLRDFLNELLLISRKYNLVLDTFTPGAPPLIVDVERDTIIGVDVQYLVHGDFIRAYDCESAIYDGAWQVADARVEGGVRRQDARGVAPGVLDAQGRINSGVRPRGVASSGR